MEELFNLKYTELIPALRWIIFGFCVALSIWYGTSPSCKMLLKQNSPYSAIIVSLLFIVILGFRRVVGGGYGDTTAYANSYKLIAPTFTGVDWSGDWFFNYIQIQCKIWHLTVSQFFFVIELGYIGFMLVAFWRALWENVWFAMLFAFSAMSFYSYGVNGLRNGLACSMIMMAFVFVAHKRKHYYWAIPLCVLAVGVHKSVMLPIAAFLITVYIIKANIKSAVWIWLSSTIVSMIAGEQIMSLFLGWGFDDRLDDYLTSTEYMDMFSRKGFRWDFVLYSSVPVVFSWYISSKDNIKDKVFNILSCTYIISNAFWVMICRTSSSNRFAYLSWFLYPLIIAYAAIRLPIWEDQDRKAGMILFLHVSFTMILVLLGK